MAHTYRKPPISSHRLFPAIVAVWFAALFGLGCLVLPAVLLERAADASRIAKLVPAAAPPLGLTARIALAAAAAVFGALLGFAIARRVAIAQAPAPPVNFDRLLRPADEVPPERAWRPIAASEELGAPRFDAPVEASADGQPAASFPLARKRPLALPEEPRSEPDQFLQFDPLPGESESRFSGAQAAPPQADAQAYDEPGAPVAERAEEPAPALSGPVSSEPSQARRPATPTRGRAALAEPLRALLAGEMAPVDKVGGPLGQLGMAELAERLARSLHKFDSKAPAASAVEPKTEVPPSAPAAFAPPPAALRPFKPELEEFGEDEEDEAFDFPFVAKPPAEAAERAGDGDGGDEDKPAEEYDSTGYGSLLAMAGPPRPFDAPPETASAAQTAAPLAGTDPAETERALRSALATLQRMSGAA